MSEYTNEFSMRFLIYPKNRNKSENETTGTHELTQRLYSTRHHREPGAEKSSYNCASAVYSHLFAGLRDARMFKIKNERNAPGSPISPHKILRNARGSV